MVLVTTAVDGLVVTIHAGLHLRQADRAFAVLLQLLRTASDRAVAALG